MNYKKILSILIVTLTLVTFTATKVSAYSYNYDYWKNVVYSSEGLSHKDTYYGSDILNVTDKTPLDFDMLEDIAIYGDQIYLLDSRNRSTDKITVRGTTITADRASTFYVMNRGFSWTEQKNIFPITEEVKARLDAFYNITTPLTDLSGKIQEKPYFLIPDAENPETYYPYIILNDAKGITVTQKNIYVADTLHNRVVKIDKDTYTVTGVYLTPNDETFQQIKDVVSEGESEKPKFLPIKLAIDVANRVYVIADRIYEGILEFNDNGNFNRFLGVNKVVANPLKAFWTKIMSETQIAQIRLDLPPMFTNLAIDNKGFLYTTSKPSSETAVTSLIKAINTSGKDVLKRNGYSDPSGDPAYVSASRNPNVLIGPSDLNAITVNENGIYTAVDKKRGRLFTYDNEGNLLYITGERGELSYNLNDPVAVRYLGNDILVVDRSSRSIIVFKVTEFGQLINEATELYNEGKVIEAEAKWRDIVKMNTNYQLAYVGIGKSLLRQNRYEEAMENFKIGRNQTYYSKAFQGYRDEWLERNFAWIATSLVLATVGFCVYGIFASAKRRRQTPNYGGDE